MANNVQDLISSLPDDKIGKKIILFVIDRVTVQTKRTWCQENTIFTVFPTTFQLSLHKIIAIRLDSV